MNAIYYIQYYKGNDTTILDIYNSYEDAITALSKIFCKLIQLSDSWKTEPVMKDSCGLSINTKGRGYYHVFSLPVNDNTEECVAKMRTEILLRKLEIGENNGFDWGEFERLGESR